MSESRSRRLTDVLVVVEVALAVVLLAGAGAMVRSFLDVFRADPTFRVEDLVAAQLELPDARYASLDAHMNFYRHLTTRLSSVSGVESVSLSSSPPGINAARSAFRPYETADALSDDEQSRPMAVTQRIGPTYFSTLGVGLLAGRPFRDTDRSSTLAVAIVNERFASRQWPSGSAVGKRVRLYRGDAPEVWLTIVGLVPNIVRTRERQEPDPTLYVPYAQAPGGPMWVMTRASTPFSEFATTFRRELQTIDAELAVIVGPALMTEWFARAYQFRGVIAALFLVFASVALLLASLGLNAVVSHSVAQRTQEIGVRSALGATASDILGLVLRQGLRTITAGLALGLTLWFAINGVLQSSLAGVSPMDPTMLALVCIVLVGSASIGCLLPARRAIGVDVITALRPE